MEWNYLSIPKLHQLHNWSLGLEKYFHPTLHLACDYFSMLGLNLNHVGKRGPSLNDLDIFSQNLNILR